ncbi:unnamed protein product [Prorocentrum cordatum]|uniref:Uncharacterized protein n=1 Tax=Prorocentrum cordatum TaxID=2364126 RepID=A0ABN9WVM4_9DINO|nr:unnamed protein product [Polarella glacialis]
MIVPQHAVASGGPALRDVMVLYLQALIAAAGAGISMVDYIIIAEGARDPTLAIHSSPPAGLPSNGNDITWCFGDVFAAERTIGTARCDFGTAAVGAAGLDAAAMTGLQTAMLATARAFAVACPAAVSLQRGLRHVRAR